MPQMPDPSFFIPSQCQKENLSDAFSNLCLLFPQTQGVHNILLTKFQDISKTFPGQNLKIPGQNTYVL